MNTGKVKCTRSGDGDGGSLQVGGVQGDCQMGGCWGVVHGFVRGGVRCRLSIRHGESLWRCGGRSMAQTTHRSLSSTFQRFSVLTYSKIWVWLLGVVEGRALKTASAFCFFPSVFSQQGAAPKQQIFRRQHRRTPSDHQQNRGRASWRTGMDVRHFAERRFK